MMVDTNIIIDLREMDTRWFDWSLNALATLGSGERLASAVVVGELAARGGAEEELTALLTEFEIDPLPLNVAAGFRAGFAHRAYRDAGGKRDKLLADFLIGAHAATIRQPLLTRDPRRYRTYFPDLTLITPESHP